MNTTLIDYISKRLEEFDQITGGRRTSLERLATLITGPTAAGRDKQIIFFCTHNSRRSQMAQIWASTAAHHFAVKGVISQSAGVLATEVDRRTVETLERVGFACKRADGPNPLYTVQIGDPGRLISLFSKTLPELYQQPTSFIAVMTCSDADRKCPVIDGASNRLTLCYDDPKVADGSTREADVYDQCCRSISRDLLYAFSRIKTRSRN
jgi:protein-tyrosine-phosphatase